MKTRQGLGILLLATGVALAFALFNGWSWFSPPASSVKQTQALALADLAYPRASLHAALCGNQFYLHEALAWLGKQGFQKDQFCDDESQLNQACNLANQQSHPRKPVLAQSFAAATISLALTLEQDGGTPVIAIPSEMQRATPWYQSELLRNIPYASDKLTSEDLCALSPTCIASSFSSPTTIQQYRRLGLDTEILPAPTTFESIWCSFDRVAKIVGQPQRGQKLRSLCCSSLQWLASQLEQMQVQEQDLIILELYRHFSMPSDRHLYVHWIHKNLFKDKHANHTSSPHPWSVAVDYETLYTLRPRWIIILCENPKQAERYLNKSLRWQQFIQTTKCHYALVPTACLHSPTQLIVLGLYDIVRALHALQATSKRMPL